MIRKIIQIDETKCNGCGKCANACHEKAIAIVNGKAVLIRDDYCDGLGDCLPTCPTGAITFAEREAIPYDEEAVKANKACQSAANEKVSVGQGGDHGVSRLTQWPCQIKLMPIDAPYYDNAELLIAADCTAYAYAGIHENFMRGKVTVIGCPKLDAVNYGEKLADIFRSNNIREITVLRMEVPCCGGLEAAVKRALQNCGKTIPCKVKVISIKGKIKNG